MAGGTTWPFAPKRAFFTKAEEVECMFFAKMKFERVSVQRTKGAFHSAYFSRNEITTSEIDLW